MSDSERIERLETIVRALSQQMAELREDVRVLRGAAAPGAAARAEAQRPVASSPKLDPYLTGTTPRTTPAQRPVASSPKLEALRAPAVSGAEEESVPGRPATAPFGKNQLPGHPPVARSWRGGVATLDFEELVGRYGTIALATLALLTGAGAFLTWAIAHGLLGPAQRVVLGAIGAAVVGVVGWRLRARGTMRFGNTLLALALALLHLDLWAAGPRLHVVSPSLALIIIASASVALAVLAIRAADEPLFCVGLGGALVAPFVTSSEGGSAALLVGYGWIVITAGVVALRATSWRIAVLILAAGCAIYAGAAHQLTNGDASWLERGIPSEFALACAWAALVWGGREVRARLALAFLAVAATAQLSADWTPGHPAFAIALGLAGTITAAATPRFGTVTPGWKLVGTVLLPLGFLGAALGGLEQADTLNGAAVALLWAVVAFVAAWRAEAERDLHLAGAAMTSGAAVLLGLHSSPEWCVGALAAHGSLFSLLLRQRRTQTLGVPIALILAIAWGWSYLLLDERFPYIYPPFLTGASAAALAAVLGWWVFARSARSLPAITPLPLWVIPPVIAFLWVRKELMGAFAADIAIFLLIAFYALVGLGAIFYGRLRSLSQARAAGLALACYATLKALVHAWGISAIGLRVGSLLLAGIFIALVAYWYRAPDPDYGVQGAGFRGQGLPPDSDFDSGSPFYP